MADPSTGGTLVDTDVLIDCLRGRPEAIAFLEGQTRPPLVCAVTLTELYAGARDAELSALDRFVEALEIIPVTDGIARAGGLFRRDFGPSHGTGVVDGIIAAAAVSCRARLATLHRRHYPMLEDVLVPY